MWLFLSFDYLTGFGNFTVTLEIAVIQEELDKTFK